jgi:hypothetical protein
MLRFFERKLLRRIYGWIKENGIWRSRYNHELYKLYNEPDTVKLIKAGWLRPASHSSSFTHRGKNTRQIWIGNWVAPSWFGHGGQEKNPCSCQ